MIIIIEVKNPTKRIKEICDILNAKNNVYSIKVIDAENCIYRKINNDFDFEISGLDYNSKKFKATIYVWKITDGPFIVEKIHDIETVEQLSSLLENLASKYSKIDPATIQHAQSN